MKPKEVLSKLTDRIKGKSKHVIIPRSKHNNLRNLLNFSLKANLNLNHRLRDLEKEKERYKKKYIHYRELYETVTEYHKSSVDVIDKLKTENDIYKNIKIYKTLTDNYKGHSRGRYYLRLDIDGASIFSIFSEESANKMVADNIAKIEPIEFDKLKELKSQLQHKGE